MTENRAGIQYYGPDQIDRKFTVEPPDVYEGESNKTFTVTHIAEGPMYDAGVEGVASIVITIPDALHPNELDLTNETLVDYLVDHVSVTASGRVQPSGNLDVADCEC